MSLLPRNMVKYVGKIDRDSLERMIGSPIDEAEGFYYYEVYNTYDKEVTGIQCYFDDKFGKLISVRFPTRYYLGYWMDFTRITGYPKKQVDAVRKGNMQIKKDALKRVYWVNLKYKGFGCQIYDIQRHYGFETAVINYHIVK